MKPLPTALLCLALAGCASGPPPTAYAPAPRWPAQPAFQPAPIQAPPEPDARLDAPPNQPVGPADQPLIDGTDEQLRQIKSELQPYYAPARRRVVARLAAPVALHRIDPQPYGAVIDVSGH